jgi:cysteine synthase A
MNFFADNSLSIGNTPLIQIKKIIPYQRHTVFAKVEGRNPSYSVKDRIGAAMIWDAEKRGLIKPGMEIVEPTSGNTGIALSSVAAARGYRITLIMPETMSQERRLILKALGAQIVLTDGAQGMTGAVKKAEEIVRGDPEHYFMPQQFKNSANPEIHEKTTGPEIWRDTSGQIDALVSGVGTGGTITGVSRFVKKTCAKNILSVAVEPKESPVITQFKSNQVIVPGPHKIQGIGAGFVPAVLDLSLVDRVEQINTDEAFEMTRRLAREEGIFAGISSGAAMAVTERLCREGVLEGKTTVVILPDLGERYLSMNVF